VLIETYICEKYNLFYNKRQQTLGFYDAYYKNKIYEIKASNINYNTFIFKKINHHKLVAANGYYIFVSYNLKDTDKDLQAITDINVLEINLKDTDKDLRAITDINVLQTYTISAIHLNNLLIKHNITAKGKTDNYHQYKIQLSTIQRSNDLKEVINGL
jgi:hypothetical protein